MAMRFVHTSDVHLHPDKPERFEALRLVWQQAAELRCDALLIAGDLFDSADAADRLRSPVRELFESRSELRVVIVAGNHDAPAYPPGADYGKNVLVATKPFTFAVSDEIDLVAVPYSLELRPAEILRSLKLPSDRSSILLTHGSFFADPWAHVYRGLQESGEGNDFAWFPHDVAEKGFGYVALGHWHQPTEPMLHYGETVVAYSGTPCSIARDEVGCRRVVLVDTDGRSDDRPYGRTNFHCRFVELAQAPHYLRPERPWFVVPGQEDRILEEIHHYLETHANPAARVVLDVDGFLREGESVFRRRLHELLAKFESQYREPAEVNFHSVQLEISSLPAVSHFLQALQGVDPRKLLSLDAVFEKKDPAVLRTLAEAELCNPELVSLALRFGIQAFNTVLRK